MGVENWSGLRYWEPGEAASVSKGTKGVTASATPLITPKKATTSARDTDAATYLGQVDVSTIEGLRAYVTGRKGESFHNGTEWVWLAQRKALAQATRAAAADTASGALIDIILTGPFVLPAGDRWVQIRCRSICAQLSAGEARPQGVLSGTGLGLNQGVGQCTTTFLGDSGVVEIDVIVQTSGTVSYAYRGRDGHATIAHGIRFTDSYMQVFDLGPA